MNILVVAIVNNELDFEYHKNELNEKMSGF